MNSKTFTLSYLLTILSVAFLSLNMYSQCTPLSPAECPDPENNGQICPDTLPDAYLNQPYSEVITLLVPLADTTGIPLHHLTLVTVDNLPSGITWISNSPDSVFMAGNYYCILLEGSPTVADTFWLHIVLDVYVNFFGQPVYATTITDSTSVFMTVTDNTGIKEEENISIAGSYPNPFISWTSTKFFSKETAEVTLQVYNLLGELLEERRMTARPGENYFHYNGETLSPGTYCFVLRTGNSVQSRLMVRGQ
jgi:hypothetical protein